MKPIIIHPKGQPELSFLIDADSVPNTPVQYKGEIRPCRLALRAIDIRHLFPGKIQIIDDIPYPRPTQVLEIEPWEVKPIAWRRIYTDAATAMLSMPAFDCDIKTAKNGYAVDLVKDCKGWDEWRFLTAWVWSLWQDKHSARFSDPKNKRPAKYRWETLRKMGYPYDYAAFRGLCADLKLFVTKSRPNW
ncbi:MAG: hypothetical protein WCO57_02610 [Verrucomicrobiota bacterium]